MVDQIGAFTIPVPANPRRRSRSPLAPAQGAVGASVEWYTPPELFDALGLRFDLDPASPMSGPLPWIPADRFYSAAENGFVQPWEGRVWLNPPYGPALRPFLERMDAHRDGLVLVFARTSARWAQYHMAHADAVCFMRYQIAFLPADGRPSGPSGMGSMLLAYGPSCVEAVERADLGWTVDNRRTGDGPSPSRDGSAL